MHGFLAKINLSKMSDVLRGLVEDEMGTRDYESFDLKTSLDKLLDCYAFGVKILREA